MRVTILPKHNPEETWGATLLGYVRNTEGRPLAVVEDDNGIVHVILSERAREPLPSPVTDLAKCQECRRSIEKINGAWQDKVFKNFICRAMVVPGPHAPDPNEPTAREEGLRDRAYDADKYAEGDDDA
jgi:hypothetical protein